MQKLLISLLVIISLTACANNIVDVANVEQSAIVDITILKYKFIPEVLEIKKGQTIRWTNIEKRQYHSVWFEKNAEKESDYLFPGDMLQKTFDQSGEFEYRCGPHPEMIGKIIVRE